MYIESSGLVCSVGLDTDSACAAMRSGVASFTSLPYWDREHRPVVGAHVPGVSLEEGFAKRLARMLAAALAECVQRIPSHVEYGALPIFVALPEEGRPGFGKRVRTEILTRVDRLLHTRLGEFDDRIVAVGHAGGLRSLLRMREMFECGSISECIVCGVDSYVNASSLYWLDANWRLKREQHNDGVIPGEAASAIYLRREPMFDARRSLQVVGLGSSMESSTVTSEAPLRAVGMTSAARQALREANMGFHDVDYRISDITGENYGFREHVLAEAGLVQIVRKEPQPLWHPAESLGDTGAASALIQLALARSAWSKGYAPGPNVVCFASSVSGERAVAVLQGRGV